MPNESTIDKLNAEVKRIYTEAGEPPSSCPMGQVSILGEWYSADHGSHCLYGQAVVNLGGRFDIIEGKGIPANQETVELCEQAVWAIKRKDILHKKLDPIVKLKLERIAQAKERLANG